MKPFVVLEGRENDLPGVFCVLRGPGLDTCRESSSSATNLRRNSCFVHVYSLIKWCMFICIYPFSGSLILVKCEGCLNILLLKHPPKFFPAFIDYSPSIPWGNFIFHTCC